MLHYLHSIRKSCIIASYSKVLAQSSTWGHESMARAPSAIVKCPAAKRKLSDISQFKNVSYNTTKDFRTKQKP